MSGFTVLCGAALFSAVAVVLLREFGFRAAGAVAAVGGVLLLKSTLSGVFDGVITIGTRYGETLGNVGKTALQLFGIASLGSLTADLCRDLGEGGIARSVTVAAKAEMLVLILPKMLEILDAGLALWEGI